MKKNVRLVCINGINVTITGLDFDYPKFNDNVAQSKFNVTFNATLNNQAFVFTFSNERLPSKNQYFGDTFIGTGESYSQFLREVESNSKLQEKKQYSDNTENTANKVIGEIAQSVYIHVQAHSPDQDEE